MRHDIIEMVMSIEKKKTLQEILDYLNKVTDEEEEAFWSRYTPEQRAELAKSFEESFDPKNWVSHEEVKKRHTKWLS